MMSDRAKAKKLNTQIDNFFYSIDSREYIHGSTIISAVCDILYPGDVTVALRVPLTSGFTFDTDNTLQSVGWVSFENTCLFITPLAEPLHPYEQLGDIQKYLLSLNDIAQDNAGRHKKYYSKRLTVDVKNVVEKRLMPHTTNIVEKDTRNFQVRMLFQTNILIEGYLQHAYIR
jgi:hypothetical protein